jgi:hypothetical protein
VVANCALVDVLQVSHVDNILYHHPVVGRDVHLPITGCDLQTVLGSVCQVWQTKTSMTPNITRGRNALD